MASASIPAALMGPESGALCEVDCTCDRITRINPYRYDTEYTDRKCHPWHLEARSISGYERISWDEAAQICADEIRRIQKKYAPEAVLVESDMHGEGKNVAPSHGCPNRMFSILGGYTQQMRNMDSWEGWY